MKGNERVKGKGKKWVVVRRTQWHEGVANAYV